VADAVTTQDQTTEAGNGSGAPNDAPTERTYTQAELDSAAAKARRAAEADGLRRGQSDLLKRLGVGDDVELQELVEHGRKARPSKVDESARLAEKVRVQAEAEKVALQQQLLALQAERDAALLRDSIRSAIAKTHIVEGGEDLVLALLGVAPPIDHKPTVKDGKAAVVDQDGDPVSKTVDQLVADLVKSRPYLQSPTAQGVQRKPAQPPPTPKSPPRKMTRQEEMDEILRAGLASRQSGTR